MYLPAEDLDRFGVGRADLAAAQAGPAVRELLAFEVERARAHYRAAEPGIELLAPSSRPCVRVAFDLYGGILDEVERAGYQVLDQPGRGPPAPPPRRRRPPPDRRPGRRPGRAPRQRRHPRRPMSGPAVAPASHRRPGRPGRPAAGRLRASRWPSPWWWPAADGFLLWGRALATPVGAGAGRGQLPDRPGAPPASCPARGRPAGVYRYRTSGHERVDRFGIERAYPAETVRVISWRGGCRWRETVPIFTQHVETYDFCAGGADADDFAYADQPDLLPGAGRPAVRLRPRRPPPAQRAGAGQSRSWRCVDGASVSANTTLYLGPETVQTGAGPVATRHLRLLSALSGQSSGGAVRDLWLDRDGLVVKEERQVAPAGPLAVRRPAQLRGAGQLPAHPPALTDLR